MSPHTDKLCCSFFRYEERGILGQVVDAEISDSGVCEMKVSEALVNKV